MPTAKPQVVPLHSLEPGQSGDFFAVLSEKTKSATRDGKPFYTCRFRDRQRTVTFMVWGDSGWYEACASQWRTGDAFKIRALYQEHPQYGPQIEVYAIRPVNEGDYREGFDPRDFATSSRFDPGEMLQQLRGLLEAEMRNDALRELVLTILQEHEESLCQVPASERHFYPFRGGLLEHILSVTQTCLFLVRHYDEKYPDLQPPLNVDLVLAGAVLHDIGRVLEFEDRATVFEPTLPGRLLGHLFLGRDIVRDAARKLQSVDPELLLLLEHLVVSHLNLPEWGSPRLPLIPESLILHHADDLDAKVEMYVRCLREDVQDGPFTARDPALHRQLLKGRSQ